MIESLLDVLKLTDSYTSYLATKGVVFSSNGFPVLSQNRFLDEFPDSMVTFKERKSSLVVNPSKTVLCFYCPDERIYPRLDRVLLEIEEYRRFMGVVSTDVTVTKDMDIEWQRSTMLINQLFMAILAVNDIKVVLNLRNGLPETLDCFSTIPKGVTCASGLLGCMPTRDDTDFSYMEKLLKVLPSRVLLYGRNDPVMNRQLDLLGIPFRRYPDVHARYLASRKA